MAARACAERLAQICAAWEVCAHSVSNQCCIDISSWSFESCFKTMLKNSCFNISQVWLGSPFCFWLQHSTAWLRPTRAKKMTWIHRNRTNTLVCPNLSLPTYDVLICDMLWDCVPHAHLGVFNKFYCKIDQIAPSEPTQKHHFGTVSGWNRVSDCFGVGDFPSSRKELNNT